jgi:hypothetical protein
VFSVAIHAYWFQVYGGNEIFRFNGEYIITSPDGWFFGKGAKDALAGVVGIADGNMQVAALGKLAAVIKSIFPFFSLETIMFYSPVVIGSLSVVPLVLIGRLYSQPLFGFLSALFVVALPGFYGRMGFGYFDDDMLTLQMPLWVLFATLFVAREQSRISLATLAITVILYQWWYPKSFSILSALAITLFVYTLLFKREEFGLYFAVALMLLGLADMPLLLRAFGAISIVYFYDTISLMSQRARVVFILSIISIFTMLGGFEPMMGPIKMYFFRRVAESSGSGLHYYTSLKTVTESASMSFDALISDWAPNKYFFVVAIVGMLLMFFGHLETILLVPIFLVGLLAVDAGNRFAPYGNMAVGIALSYVVVFGYKISHKLQKIAAFALVGALSYFILNPVLHKDKLLQNPSSSTVIEVAEMSKLSQFANKDSLAFSWWDYGYPIMFYSGMQTLTDGGRQGGDGSFVESTALTSQNGLLSANLLKVVASSGSFEKAFEKSGISDPYGFLGALANAKVESKKDIYLVLPYRMMQIFATIEQFSNVDIRTGKRFAPRLFAFTQGLNEKDGRLSASSNLVVDKNDWSVIDSSGNKVPLVALARVNDSNGLSVQIAKNPDSSKTVGLYAIVNTNMQYLIVCDEQIFNSTFIRLFVFNGIGDNNFEAVTLSPMIKVFRVKQEN